MYQLFVSVTLSVRVWIEIFQSVLTSNLILVTLSVRVWIEMLYGWYGLWGVLSHPQCEGVD